MDTHLRHNEIELMQVMVFDQTVSVNAIQNGCIIFTKKYVVGRDFDISGGKITIHQEVHMLPERTGDPRVGPSIEKIELGLDTNGNGKWREGTYFAGLIFLFAPVEISDVHNVKFERIEGNKVYSQCH
ncbi:MAG: hypothetical protein ACYDBA_00280 [Sulfuricaulis sp.]